MGTVPVATPTPPRSWRLSRRVIALAFLGAMGIAAIVVATAIAWPVGVTAPESPWVRVANADDLEANQPVKIFDQRIYLVKQKSGEILALYQRDPHLGCTVPYRPEYEFMGRTGWFRNPCHGETYDLAGVCYAGPCPRGLDRYEVLVVDGEVRVNLGNLQEGPPLPSEHVPVYPPEP